MEGSVGLALIALRLGTVGILPIVNATSRFDIKAKYFIGDKTKVPAHPFIWTAGTRLVRIIPDWYDHD